MDFFAWVEAILLQIVRMVNQTKAWIDGSGVQDLIK